MSVSRCERSAGLRLSKTGWREHYDTAVATGAQADGAKQSLIAQAD